jgi:hypothetical protein
VELVLKDIREYRKIRDGDSHALNIFCNQLLSARMELNQHGLAGELNSAVILRELTSKLPTTELERWLLEKPDRASCAGEFFLFVEKREGITAKVMAELLAQAPGTAKVQESNKVKDSQDPKKMKAVAHAAVAAATNPAPAKPCLVPGCTAGHALWWCRVFKAFLLNERGVLVMQLKKCIFCLGDHDVAVCYKHHWAPCKIGVCEIIIIDCCMEQWLMARHYPSDPVWLEERSR